MQGHNMDSVWHSAPDSRSVPPKDVGATILSPMSKNKSSGPVGLLWNLCGVPGLHGGSFCILWAFFGGSFGKGFLLGSLEWSSGPLGFLWGPSGDQVGTRWGPVGTKWGPHEIKWEMGPSGSKSDQMGPSRVQMGASGDQQPKTIVFNLILIKMGWV